MEFRAHIPCDVAPYCMDDFERKLDALKSFWRSFAGLKGGDLTRADVFRRPIWNRRT